MNNIKLTKKDIEFLQGIYGFEVVSEYIIRFINELLTDRYNKGKKDMKQEILKIIYKVK